MLKLRIAVWVDGGVALRWARSKQIYNLQKNTQEETTERRLDTHYNNRVSLVFYKILLTEMGDCLSPWSWCALCSRDTLVNRMSSKRCGRKRPVKEDNDRDQISKTFWAY